MLFQTPYSYLTMLSLPMLLAGSVSAASIFSLSYGRLTLPFLDIWGSGPQQDALKVEEDVKVPVVLGVMSKCPDALICEATMDKVLKQVNDKVDLSLSFIGTCVCTLLESVLDHLTYHLHHCTCIGLMDQSQVSVLTVRMAKVSAQATFSSSALWHTLSRRLGGTSFNAKTSMDGVRLVTQVLR